MSDMWRNYFEDVNLKNKNYKLFIETAYGCHGSCAGCPLSIESRSSQEPKWELNNLSKTLDEFAKNLLIYREKNNFSEIENLAITVGPAENLYFTEEYLENLSLIAKKFAEDVKTKNFHLAVSTSGLFSETKVRDKIIALSKHLKRENLSFAFIINIRQFEKTSQHYYRFAELLFEYTDLVELEINLDMKIHDIKEETLVEFSKFVNAFSFVQLDFAYAINEGNQTKTYLKEQEFVNFIDVIRKYTMKDNREFFSRWNSKINPVKTDNFDFLNNFKDNYDNIVATHMRLNALGEWHFAKNILGTIYFDNTFKFPALAKNLENPFDSKSLKSFKANLINLYNTILVEHKSCQNCEYKNVCLNSGFLAYKSFSRNEEDLCSNPSFHIFNQILENNGHLESLEK